MPASDLPATRPHTRSRRPLSEFALKFGFTGIVLGLFAAVTPFQGCKAGVGETCRCATDCRGGLVCQAVGKAPLNPASCTDDSAGCCYPANSPGQCGESPESSDFGGALSGPDPEDILDMGSKRDLAMPDDTGESQGGSSGSTGATTTTETTASSSSSTTATSATSSAGTETSETSETSVTTNAATTVMGTGSSGTDSGSSGTDSATGSTGGSSTDTE